MNDDIVRKSIQIAAALDIMAKGIARNERAVTVRRDLAGDACMLHLRVADEDMGKILGPKRVTLDAIRTVIGRIGHVQGISAFTELLEPDPDVQAIGYKPKPWDKTEFERSLQTIASLAFRETVVVSSRAIETTELFQVRLSDDEPEIMREQDLKDAFETVFSGIGKTCGRAVHVALVRRDVPQKRPEPVGAKIEW